MPRRFRTIFDVDDIMQETYAQAFVEFRQDLPREFDRWLFRAATNNLKDLIRYCEAKKRGFSKTLRTCDSTGQELQYLAECLLANCTAPSLVVRRREAVSVLNREIAKLSSAHRFVLNYYDLRQWPMEQVAEKIGCSIGTAFMRRNAALAKLRKSLRLIAIEI